MKSSKGKGTKKSISALLKAIALETSPSHGMDGVKQIEELLKKLAIYEPKGKLDCHAALDFLKAAKESFSALAEDLKATRGKLDVNDSRQNVLLVLNARMERIAGEMEEAYDFVNRINRF